MKRETLQPQDWMRDVAPGDDLRRWFGHDPEKWEAFQQRYFKELKEKPATWGPLLAAAREGDITLLYSARDTEHNNAVALASYLERKMKQEQER